VNHAEYITGKPCRRGHTRKFANSPGRCVDCKHITDKRHKERKAIKARSAQSINKLLYGSDWRQA
jgi:hypothetical protein